MLFVPLNYVDIKNRASDLLVFLSFCMNHKGPLCLSDGCLTSMACWNFFPTELWACVCVSDRLGRVTSLSVLSVFGKPGCQLEGLVYSYSIAILKRTFSTTSLMRWFHVSFRPNLYSFIWLNCVLLCGQLRWHPRVHLYFIFTVVAEWNLRV